MNPFGKAVIIILVIGFCVGCADSRAQRSNEEAMMLYRDCMSGMPPQWDSGDVSAALDSEHVASAGASADSRRDARQYGECVKQARF